MSDKPPVITHAIELAVPSVPNYIMVKSAPRPREQGFNELAKFDIADLSDEQLNAIADAWRADLLASAARRRRERKP